MRRLSRAVARREYTGVHDSDDWPGRPDGEYGRFYDPEAVRPAGRYAALPGYPGLLERAQRPFRATGLDVPWLAARGNHDAPAAARADPSAFPAENVELLLPDPR